MQTIEFALVAYIALRCMWRDALGLQRWNRHRIELSKCKGHVRMLTLETQLKEHYY